MTDASASVMSWSKGALELVVGHGQQAVAALLWLDLPGHPAHRLVGELGVVERSPAVDQPPWRVVLERRVVAPVAPVGPDRSVPLGRGLDACLVEVAPCELRGGDRLPDGLRAGLDEHLVHLGGLRGLGRRGHELSSSRVVLRSASAEARRSVYLSIQRSWISRIGTGLRKCNFSRPDRRVTTRPASSSTRRCFITPKRVMSSSDSSSVSVRPSRRNSRSSRWRRVGSARALKTRSSSSTRGTICDQMVTCQPVAHHALLRAMNNC